MFYARASSLESALTFTLCNGACHTVTVSSSAKRPRGHHVNGRTRNGRLVLNEALPLHLRFPHVYPSFLAHTRMTQQYNCRRGLVSVTYTPVHTDRPTLYSCNFLKQLRDVAPLYIGRAYAHRAPVVQLFLLHADTDNDGERVEQRLR